MSKITTVLRSRKFWALIASIVAIAGAVNTGALPTAEGANALVAALAAYSIATGIEASGK